METITSRTNKKIMNLISLQKEKNRQEQGLFVDEGLKNLLMALGNNLVKEIYTTKPFSVDNPEVEIYLINDAVLDKITLNKNSDGFVFVAKIPNYKIKNYRKVIYLDNVQDPGNVGTIIRTALAFNMDAVVLSSGCASIYNNKTLAACKGAYYQIPVLSMEMADLLFLKGADQKIVTTTLSPHSVSLQDCPKLYSYILVFGNEGKGVSQNIQSVSDLLVKIDINNIDSLNVAVAAGIVINHFAQ